mgnify:CR=1 FL=1
MRKCRETQIKKAGARGSIQILYHADRYFLFGEFISEEMSRGRNLASNSLLRLEEVYKENQLYEVNLVKLKAPILIDYLNYFQMRRPHVTRVHEKMQSLLNFLNVNADASDENFSFRFEGEFKFTCNDEKELIEVARPAFEAAHSKLAK